MVRFCFIFIYSTLLFSPSVNSQTTSESIFLDSLEIYDPFTQQESIRRIIRQKLSILTAENKALLESNSAPISSTGTKDSAYAEIDGLMKSGNIFFNAAMNNIALQYYHKAHERSRSLHDSMKTAEIEIYMGRAYYYIDLLQPAVEYINRAYRTLSSSQDRSLAAYATYAKGTLETDPDRAAQYFRKALDIQTRLMHGAPDDPIAKERYTRYLNANGYFSEALTIAEEIGNPWLTVLYRNNIAQQEYSSGRYDRAIDLLRHSLKICKRSQLTGLLKNTYINLAVVYRLKGDWKRSSQYKEIAGLLTEHLYSEEHTIQTSEMKVKYETTQKELENELLKKENLIITDSINDQLAQNYRLIASIVVLSLFIIYFIINRRRLTSANNQLADQTAEIQNQKLHLEVLNESLRRSETNLNNAQAATHLANWEWNVTTGSIAFSKEMPNIYGIDEIELQSNFQQCIVGCIHPDDRSKFMDFFSIDPMRLVNDQHEYRILCNGKEKWIRSKRIALQDDNGIVTKIFGTVQDITEGKIAEEERIQLISQQMFTKQLIQSQEQERKRIAGELHDSLGQDVLLIKNRAQLGLQGKNNDPFTIEQLHHIDHASNDVLNTVRDLAYNLRPAHLERLGVTQTISSLIGKMNETAAVHFTADIDSIDGLLDNEAEINLFRIIQEAINNIMKHSAAESAEIRIFRAEKQIEIEIIDNGKGFDSTNILVFSQGFGLINIANRVKLLKGILDIHSRISSGTKLFITLPIGTK